MNQRVSVKADIKTETMTKAENNGSSLDIASQTLKCLCLILFNTVSIPRPQTNNYDTFI